MTSTSPESRLAAPATSSQWTFLTNHAHVLLAIARDHDVRLREIASQVGITERAVQKIIAELEESGALTKSRDGRRNHYEVNTEVSLRHPMEAHRTINALVRMVLDDPASSNGNGDGHHRLADRSVSSNHAGNGDWHANGATDGNGHGA